MQNQMDFDRYSPDVDQEATKQKLNQLITERLFELAKFHGIKLINNPDGSFNFAFKPVDIYPNNFNKSEQAILTAGDGSEESIDQACQSLLNRLQDYAVGSVFAAWDVGTPEIIEKCLVLKEN